MLSIVATPIGNLKDITLRALETLKIADVIACEDTRHTKILLDHYQITRPLVSFHQHSKIQKIDQLVAELKAGKHIALVTDAGTPGISDPGNKLVAAAIEQGIEIVPIPGASALTSALSVAGLPTDRFTFYGFLPHKKGKQTILQEIGQAKTTSVFFESTHRILKTLEAMRAWVDDDRQVVIARELTKKFESLYRGSLTEVIQQLQSDTTKGEFVVIVRGK